MTNNRLKKWIITSIAVNCLFNLPLTDSQFNIYNSVSLINNIAHAEVKTYTATGEDFPNQYEKQEIAKLRARAKAIRKATEQAGVYLQTYSKSINGNLTADEISAITIGSYEVVDDPVYERMVQQVTNETAVIIWKATVKVNVDDAEIQEWLKLDPQTRNDFIKQNQLIQQSAADNDRKIEDLRKRYKTAASDSERAAIQAEYEQIDNEFLANQKFEEGYKLFYKKKYKGAIFKFTEAIKFNPNFTKAYTWRGRTYNFLNRQNEAIADFTQAIKLDPNNSMAYNDRAISYDKIQNYSAAMIDYTKAIESTTDDGDPRELFTIYVNRGVTYSKLKNYNSALADFNKAVEIYPDFEGVYYNRADVYRKLGNYNSAIADYTKVLEMNPADYTDVYSHRGFSYAMIGKHNEAIADLTKAIEFEPDEKNNYRNRGLAYAEINKHFEAIADFTRYLEFVPNDSAIYYNRGNSYAALENYEAALADYTKAIEFDPADVSAYNNRVIIYYNLKRYSEAIADFTKLIELNPQNKHLYYKYRGLCYQGLGDTERAEADFAKARSVS